MLATHHGRDQIAYVRVGATRDGKITAFHTKILADLGAYLMLLTPTIPSLGAFVMSGVYDIPAVQTDIIGVFTNKIPTDAIRGAGPARGDAHDRGLRRPARGRARAWTGSSCAGRTSWTRRASRTRPRSASSTTPATTRRALDLLLEHFDARRRARPQARRGQAARHRLLHLHRDLRPGAVARHRPVGLRPADRPVGVGDGARAHHRRGHRLHRHLAARPGAGDDDGADRRRPARHRPAERRGHPRRHRAPARRAWAPTARARPRSAASRSPARRPRSSTRRARSSPTSSRRRPRTSSSPPASSRSRARPTRA